MSSCRSEQETEGTRKGSCRRQAEVLGIMERRGISSGGHSSVSFHSSVHISHCVLELFSELA